MSIGVTTGVSALLGEIWTVNAREVVKVDNVTI